jgi:hypothetical protein
MKLEKTTGVRFEEQRRIANRSDALELLDVLIKASFVENLFSLWTRSGTLLSGRLFSPSGEGSGRCPSLPLFWKPLGPYGSGY